MLEYLATGIDISLLTERVIGVLECLKTDRGLSKKFV